MQIRFGAVHYQQLRQNAIIQDKATQDSYRVFMPPMKADKDVEKQTLPDGRAGKTIVRWLFPNRYYFFPIRQDATSTKPFEGEQACPASDKPGGWRPLPGSASEGMLYEETQTAGREDFERNKRGFGKYPGREYELVLELPAPASGKEEDRPVAPDLYRFIAFATAPNASGNPFRDTLIDSFSMPPGGILSEYELVKSSPETEKPPEPAESAGKHDKSPSSLRNRFLRRG